MRIVERRVKTGNKGFVIYDLKGKQGETNTRRIAERKDQAENIQLEDGNNPSELLNLIREKYGIRSENSWIAPLQEIEIPNIKSNPPLIPALASAYEPTSPNTSMSEIIVNEGSFNMDLDQFIQEQEEYLKENQILEDSQNNEDFAMLQNIRNKYLKDESSSVLSFTSSPVRISDTGSPIRLHEKILNTESNITPTKYLGASLVQNGSAELQDVHTGQYTHAETLFSKTLEKLENDEASYSSSGTANCLNEKPKAAVKETREFYCQADIPSLLETKDGFTQIEILAIESGTQTCNVTACQEIQTEQERSHQSTQCEFANFATKPDVENKSSVYIQTEELPKMMDNGAQTERVFSNSEHNTRETQCDIIEYSDAQTQSFSCILASSSCQTEKNSIDAGTQKSLNITDIPLDSSRLDSAFERLNPDVVLNHKGGNFVFASLKQRYKDNLRKIKHLELTLSLYK
ncbi:hypothetical protein HK103_003557 [Boothiomyces macroporosus]|uniref:Uncharacterized protein n=1 Tax=Boothiomyces macroporosus TaxID=261099 RepID=A0AAD5UHQ8_9FUNG|nr:hypothetical protein HK103_003557 [Boothiomyces macroporosus]